MKKYFLIIVCLWWAFPASAQSVPEFGEEDNVLETVFITGNKLKDFSVGQTLTHLSDSVLIKNNPLLTNLLQFHTPIYFKENGLGMASSPSFRGTTASQTAVLWNGININSNFLGQTDFNTLNIAAYDDIDVRAGGGSLVYGSGAIGGTVHLNTELNYEKEFKNRIFVGYGSYQTLDTRYKMNWANEKWSFRMALAHNRSDNDYKYQLREGKNTNGEFRNFALSTGLGYKLNSVNQLRWYSELYDSNRHFPVYYLTEVPTKYQDFNTRNLLEWDSRLGQFNSLLKAAFWTEDYKYFPDLASEDHSFGKAQNAMLKYDLSFKPTSNTLLNALVDHHYTNAKGSDVQHETRNISSLGLLFKHQLFSKFRYQLGVRQEITQSYGSPFLYSVGAEYEFNKIYTLKLSGSRNFRRPTYNDLFWTGSGKPNLKAENSYQIELGNSFSFQNFEFTLTGYFNDIEDMIHWLPGSNGLFEPYNEDHIQTYGAETLIGWKERFGDHHFSMQGSYAYTVSKDLETKKQLIYVPYHKATLSLSYAYEGFGVDIQSMYNGEVFMRTDNDPNHILSDYSLVNLGLSYKIGKQCTYQIGGRVNNLFDKAYENVRRYEMPGINYNIYLNLNF